MNNKVIWTEGMFLRPAHFQQQDRSIQAWVEGRCHGLQPYSWGITQLEIDDHLLALGKFAIKQCTGIFADGTPFNIPNQHAVPTPLNIAADIKDQIIYLALPVARSSGKEICWETSVNDDISRYSVKEIDIKDTHSPNDQPEATLHTGDLWTRLRLSGLNQSAYTTIPIARIVELKADKQIVLDAQFIPTCMYYGASQRLVDYLQEIVSAIHQRGEALAQRLAAPGTGGTAEIVDFLFLQIINRYQPLLQHWLQLPALHPQNLFSLLIQFAGELVTITRDNHRLKTPFSYDHDDLQKSFDPVVEELRKALSWVSESRAIPIPLEEHPHQIRTAMIKDTQLLHDAEFILAASSQLPVATLQGQLPNLTTVATVEKLRNFVMSQVRGVNLVALAVAPRQLPFHQGMCYFQLDKNNALWQEIQQSGTIAMHFSGEYPGLELEFWAIRG